MVAVDLVIELHLADPAVGEIVLEVGEDGAGVLLPTAPLGSVVEGAGDVVAVALAVEEREAARPARSLGIVVLIVGADATARPRTLPDSVSGPLTSSSER